MSAHRTAAFRRRRAAAGGGATTGRSATTCCGGYGPASPGGAAGALGPLADRLRNGSSAGTPTAPGPACGTKARPRSPAPGAVTRADRHRPPPAAPIPAGAGTPTTPSPTSSCRNGSQRVAGGFLLRHLISDHENVAGARFMCTRARRRPPPVGRLGQLGGHHPSRGLPRRRTATTSRCLPARACGQKVLRGSAPASSAGPDQGPRRRPSADHRKGRHRQRPCKKWPVTRPGRNAGCTRAGNLRQATAPGCTADPASLAGPRQAHGGASHPATRH